MDKLRNEINNHFETEYQASLKFKPTLKNTTDPTYRGSRTLTHKWSGMQFSQWGEEPEQTGYDTAELLKIGEATCDIPSDFNLHPRLGKMFFEPRRANLSK